MSFEAIKGRKFRINIMSDPIITVDNISKRYFLGKQSAKGDGLRHVLENAARSPLDGSVPGRAESTPKPRSSGR